MRRHAVSLVHGVVFGLLVALGGCIHEEALPPVPPVPDDLSTWTVPALVPLPRMPPTLVVADVPPTKAEQVAPFVAGTIYAASVTAGWPLDLVLERGEQVRNIVGGSLPGLEGQPPKLETKEGASGQGESQQAHIFLSAAEAGLSTGLVVTTTKRTYLLDVKSVKTSPIRVIRWTYKPSQESPAPSATPDRILPDPATPAQWHVGYMASQPAPAWTPTIVDDGRKTYLLFSPVVLYGSVPLVREVTVQGPAVLNTRQVGPVIIVDKLVERLELRQGTGEPAQVVTLTRGTLKTINCPGDADCPLFPQATLAGRQP